MNEQSTFGCSLTDGTAFRRRWMVGGAGQGRSGDASLLAAHWDYYGMSQDAGGPPAPWGRPRVCVGGDGGRSIGIGRRSGHVTAARTRAQRWSPEEPVLDGFWARRLEAISDVISDPDPAGWNRISSVWAGRREENTPVTRDGTFQSQLEVVSMSAVDLPAR